MPLERFEHFLKIACAPTFDKAQSAGTVHEDILTHAGESCVGLGSWQERVMQFAKSDLLSRAARLLQSAIVVGGDEDNVVGFLFVASASFKKPRNRRFWWALAERVVLDGHIGEIESFDSVAKSAGLVFAIS